MGLVIFFFGGGQALIRKKNGYAVKILRQLLTFRSFFGILWVKIEEKTLC